MECWSGLQLDEAAARAPHFISAFGPRVWGRWPVSNTQQPLAGCLTDAPAPQTIERQKKKKKKRRSIEQTILGPTHASDGSMQQVFLISALENMPSAVFPLPPLQQAMRRGR
jgi:hypothetical protein